MAQKLSTTVKSVTVAGTAVALSATELGVASIVIRANPTNTDNIFIGDSSVDAATGWILQPGESIPITGDLVGRTPEGIFLNEIFIDSAANGDSVRAMFLLRR